MLTDLLGQFERHLQILRALSRDSVDSYRVKVEEFILWLEHDGRSTEPAKITRQDVEAFLEHLFYRGNSNATRLSKLIAVQHFARFLVYEGRIRKDFTADIPRPRVHRKFVQKYTQDEVYRFFAQCDIGTEVGLRDACLLILLAFAGLRANEICRLSLENVIDDGKHIDINVPDEIGKQNAYRTVYLWKAPSLMIRQWYGLRLSQGAGPRSLLFITYRRGDRLQGMPFLPRDLDRLVKRLADRAGIRKAKKTAHMFRATHASDLRQVRGYDIAAIAERLGHKNISTTDRYLPSRGRIVREYPSLAVYWSGFSRIWLKKEA